MALNGLVCADVPFRTYTLTHSEVMTLQRDGNMHKVTCAYIIIVKSKAVAKLRQSLWYYLLPVAMTRCGSFTLHGDIDMPICSSCSPVRPGPGYTRQMSLMKCWNCLPTGDQRLLMSLQNQYLQYSEAVTIFVIQSIIVLCGFVQLYVAHRQLNRTSKLTALMCLCFNDCVTTVMLRLGHVT